tara:strand:+ start:307 stop:618 length:312 start_codon:yes stop_codon:yes gene_type:complete
MFEVCMKFKGLFFKVIEFWYSAFLTYLGMNAGFTGYQTLMGKADKHSNHVALAESLSVEPKTLSIIVLVASALLIIFGVHRLLRLALGDSDKQEITESGDKGA